MIITNVTVLGGSGFVGTHICSQLAARGYRVVVPTRRRESAKALTTLPTVDVITADLHDPEQLAAAIRGADAVINLVGVLHDARGPAGFEGAHVGLARKVVAACEAEGVARLLHMSALNAAADGPSQYLKTKGRAEALVRDSSLAWTMFRPSVIFGAEDQFLNTFACLQRFTPVMLLAGAEARFQPVHVSDVAAAFVAALEDPGSIGRSYDLVGPRVYTLRELVKIAGRLSGHPRPVLGLGEGLGMLQAFMLEMAPIRLMSRDNVLSMKVDSVSSAPFPFGIVPSGIEAVAPGWLSTDGPRYSELRHRAGR